MDHELLLARSITQAQHMVRSLGGCGIRSALMRAPVGLTDRGCAYGVRLRPGTLEAALTCLQAAGIKHSRTGLCQLYGVRYFCRCQNPHHRYHDRGRFFASEGGEVRGADQ